MHVYQRDRKKSIPGHGTRVIDNTGAPDRIRTKGGI